MKVFPKEGVICALALMISLQACSRDEGQPSQNQVPEQQQVSKAVEPSEEGTNQSKTEYQPEYVYAVDLNKSMQNNDMPFIFDVRSSHAFEKSHITDSFSMPYGKTDDAMLAAIDSLAQESEIVTYCGCPRHLSTLAAEDLNKRGYENVRVLYEGYWYWKDQGFPVFEAEGDTATTHLELGGDIRSALAGGNDVDLFLIHPNTGQVEAVRTDAQGQFKVDFKLYDYHPGDAIHVMAGSLDSPPVQKLSLAEGETTRITLSL